MGDFLVKGFSGSLSRTRPARTWTRQNPDPLESKPVKMWTPFQVDFTPIHFPLIISTMDSVQLARYIEETDGISKPWLLMQLRLKKLQERRETISDDEYLRELEELHAALMQMGEWWVGIEHEVFRPD
jgi:hypothetical protein